MKHYIVFLSAVLFALSLKTTAVFGQDRAMWATIWSIGTPQKIDKIIATAKQYNFNKFCSKR